MNSAFAELAANDLVHHVNDRIGLCKCPVAKQGLRDT